MLSLVPQEGTMGYAPNYVTDTLLVFAVLITIWLFYHPPGDSNA